ncbi:hypothetical protein V7S43_010073 [Phytophthora oleae]|uniref:Ricin B lectin domain-containing protein n=1 Tax=Phytophthora oleae TaxID=2107226 RepID=A0ABD3FGB4_9STRA
MELTAVLLVIFALTCKRPLPSKFYRTMDLSDIPFNVPIIVHSIQKCRNLQNPVGTNQARCLGNNRDMYEQLVLRFVENDRVTIQSARNDRYLQVCTNGDCVFDSNHISEQSLFTMETNSTCSIFFVSSFTGNALQCDDELIVRCSRKSRLESEAWRLIEPQVGSNSPTTQLRLQQYSLAGRGRQYLILDLAKGGKTPDEIEQIVTRLFDLPAADSYSMNKK